MVSLAVSSKTLKSLNLKEEQVVEFHTISPELWDLDYTIQILIAENGNGYVSYVSHNGERFKEEELDREYMHLLRHHRHGHGRNDSCCYMRP